MSLYEKLLWYLFGRLMSKRGYNHMDIKQDENGDIEAFTFTNNKDYIDQVEKIE
jgi:hypothetical protein